MVVKNFTFRQQWLDRKVAGMKKNLDQIFVKGPVKELLKQHFG